MVFQCTRVPYYREKQVRKRYVKNLYKHLVGLDGCKRTRMNIEKRLKRMVGCGVYFERKVYGIYNGQNRKRKTEIKNLKKLRKKNF